MIAPVEPPFDFLGRYLDQHKSLSQDYPGVENLYPVGAFVVPERDRIYLNEGAVLAAERLSGFEQKMLQPLREQPVPYCIADNKVGNFTWVLPWETHAWPTGYCDLASPIDPGPDATNCLDGWRFGYGGDPKEAVTIQDVDFDDRGYVYLAIDPRDFAPGIGILLDDGVGVPHNVPAVPSPAGGTRLKLIKHIHPYGNNNPWLARPLGPSVISFRSGDDTYLLNGGNPNRHASALIKITDPSSPQYLHTIPERLKLSVKAKVRFGNSHILAFATGDQLQIYNASSLVQSSDPVPAKTFDGIYQSITTDGVNFYATKTNSVPVGTVCSDSSPCVMYRLSIFKPARPGDATSYTEVPVDLSLFTPVLVRFGSGYLSMVGYDHRIPNQPSSLVQGYWDVQIYKVNGLQLSQVPTGSYLSKAYEGITPGSEQTFLGGPGRLANSQSFTFKIGNKLFFHISNWAVGDIFRLSAPAGF